MSKAVDRFNAIVGNSPKETLEEILEQIVNQCTYLVEEVLEMKYAAKEGNLVEVIDGYADIKYVADYLPTLLEAAGFKHKLAFKKVCDNNDEKWVPNYEVAERWWGQQEDMCYIQSTEYKGVLYYTVRRKSDDKVMKYKNFPKVNLKTCVPKG